MEPISASLGVLGLGLQMFGGFSAASKANQANTINQGIASDERAINDQKRVQMEMEARRGQMEQFRNIQRLRAQGTAAAVNQGAQTGSGLQGGLAQVSDQGLFNLQGINQGLAIGENIFNINNDISNKKMQLSQVQSDAAADQAWASLGGALVKNSGTIGGLSKDIAAGFGSLFSAPDFQYNTPLGMGGIGSK